MKQRPRRGPKGKSKGILHLLKQQENSGIYKFYLPYSIGHLGIECGRMQKKLDNLQKTFNWDSAPGEQMIGSSFVR